MAGIRDLFMRLIVDNKEFRANMAESGQSLEDFGKKAGYAQEFSKDLGQQIESYLGPAAIAGTAIALGKVTWELGEMGARAQAQERNLTAFAGGLEQASQFMDAVIEASGKTISQMDATGVATQFLQMGLADTTDEMDLYIEGATRLGKQTESAGQRVQEMVQLLKNQNVEMLDNFGLSRQMVTARAEELVATQGLVREEATLQAIQEEIARQLEVLGPRAEGGADALDQLDATIENLKLALAEDLAPAIIKVAQFLTKLLEQDDVVNLFQELEASGQDMGSTFLEVAANMNYLTLARREGALGIEDLIALGQEWGATEQEIMAAGRALGLSEAEVAKAVSSRADETIRARVATEMMTTANEENSSALYVESDAYRQTMTAAELFEQSLRDGFTWTQSLAGQYQLLSQSLEEVADSFRQVTIDEATKAFESNESRLRSRLMSLVGIVDSATLQAMYDRYLKEFQDVTGKTDFLLDLRGQMIWDHLDSEVGAYQNAATQEEQSLQDMYEAQQQAYEDMKSLVQQALQPTQVSILDTLGEYVNKWDEAARRLDAIAERGFAELSVHPDWIDLLEIPPEILAANEDVLKAWAAQVSDAVRNLERPDLLDISGAVNAVREEIERQAAVELSLELVANAAIEAGIVSGPDAERQVAQALGLESPIPVSLELATTAQQDLLQALNADSLGLQAGEEILVGVETTLSKSTAIAVFTRHLDNDVDRNRGPLRSVGAHAWQAIEPGFKGAMGNTDFLAYLARLVSPYVAEELKAQEVYGGDYS